MGNGTSDRCLGLVFGKMAKMAKRCWYEDAVMFRDEPDDEKCLIDSIIKFKYNDDEMHIDDAKREAETINL